METTKLKIAGGNGFVEIDMNKSSRFDVEITDADYPLVNLDFTCEEIAKELAEALDELIRDIYNEGARINKKSGEAAISKYRGMKP